MEDNNFTRKALFHSPNFGEGIAENEYFFCQWQYAGSAFDSMGASTGACEINVQFASQPGEGFLTVLVRQNLCTQSAVFPLSVKVTNP